MKTILEHLKAFWHIIFLGKEWVVNDRKKTIHHFTCEYCDNIFEPRRATSREITALGFISGYRKCKNCCK